VLLVAAVSLSILGSSAFGQTQTASPPTAEDRAAAAQRETGDLEKARADDALRHSDLRMQVQGNDQGETPAPPQSPSLESTEENHPNWFNEPNTYKPCPENQCPSPSQK
jgi:hypothetical protein